MKAKKVKAKSEFDEFVKEVKDLKIATDPYIPGDHTPGSGPAIAIYWQTGGIGGGSCWDNGDEDPHYNMGSNPEPEFTDIDKVLEHFVPNITFLQYKRLLQDCIEQGETTLNDYYGNHTDYAYKVIKLEALFKYMKGIGWLK